jgi:hypothetical protein
VRLEKVSLLRNVLSIFWEAFFVYGLSSWPPPHKGQGRNEKVFEYLTRAVDPKTKEEKSRHQTPQTPWLG